MSLAYFPFYPADYEADTAHLSLEEDGAYNRLLRLCWSTPGCSIPDDRGWIMRRMRVSEETYDRVVAIVLSEFFKRRRGRLYSPRLSAIFEETNAAHKRRVEAGRKGGRPSKALKTNEAEQSNAKAMPKQPEPEPEPYKEDTDVSSYVTTQSQKLEPKARLPANWTLSDEGWAYARSKQIPDEDIADEARGFHAYWSDRSGPDARKSARGWEQCWAGWCRRIAGRYAKGRGMAVSAKATGHGRGGSIASVVAQRILDGKI